MVEDLIGIWRHPEGMVLKLNEDGTYRLAEIVARLETLPSELGRFELEGRTFTFITSNESPACTGQTGSYQVELTEQGKLRFVSLQDDPCQWRADGAPVAWEQVGPSLVPGTYVTTITQEDFLAREDLHLVARSILLGEWQMTLTEGNRYSHDEVTESGQTVVAEEGYYTLTRDQMVFTAEGGNYACIGPQGIYQWALDGKTLTLTTIEDPCPERNTLNSAHPWSRQD